MNEILEEFSVFYSGYLNESEVLPPALADFYEVSACLHLTEDKGIYVLTEIHSGKQYILKMVSKENLLQSEAERDILQSLDHPCIPKLHKWFTDGDFTYLVRDYIEGITLDALVAGGGTLSEQKAVEVCVQICDLLAYLHSQTPPVIHRDIKPQNFVLCPDGKVRLIDFDASRRYQEDAKSDTVFLGTAQTAAPEQFGYRQTNQRTDIYSLGIILIYLCTGSYELSNIALMPAGLRKIASKCTMFSPDDRFTAMKEVKRNLLRRKSAFRGLKTLLYASAVFGALLLLGLTYHAKEIMASWADNPQGVPFVNAQIEQAVRDKLGIPADKPLTKSDLATVSSLSVIGDLPFSVIYTEITHDYYMAKIKYRDKEVRRGSVDSLADLQNLPFLRELTLINQQISSLEGIETLHLSRLEIGYNNIVDLTPLSSMRSLVHLSIICNPIEDLTPLQGLQKLEYLQICGTTVTDLAPLTKIKSLAELDVFGMQYLDLSPLDEMNLRKVYK